MSQQVSAHRSASDKLSFVETQAVVEKQLDVRGYEPL